jgi:uncharacterized delta-60 repeat protein
LKSSTHRRKTRRPASETTNFERLEDRRLMSAGVLDPTFGTGGRAQVGLIAKDTAVDRFNRTIVVGLLNKDTAVQRFTPNGTPDPTFGTNGLVTTDFGGLGDGANRVVVQSDGKIVVGGFQQSGPNTGNGVKGRFALARYNNDGTLDSTFGTGGTALILSEQTSANFMTGLSLQGGKIVFSASVKRGDDFDFITVRVNSNGSLDTTFGEPNGSQSKGYIVTGFGGNDYASAQITQFDGKIVVAGTNTEDTDQFILARYNSNGRLDTSYGQGGRVETTLVRDSTLYSISQDINSKGIVAAGSWRNSDGTLSALIRRFDENGAMNSTFGSVRFKAAADSRSSMINSIFVRGTTISVVGSDYVAGNHGRVFSAQFHLGGETDTSFGSNGNGIVVFDQSANAIFPRAALPPDGNMVVSYQGDVFKPSGVMRFRQMVPIVSLVDNGFTAFEGTQNGSFKVMRSGRYDFPTRVFINLRGDAVYNKDYTTSNMGFAGGIFGNNVVAIARGFNVNVGGVKGTPDQGYVDIPAFQDNVIVPVNVIDDKVLEPQERATFILSDDPAYRRSQQAHDAFVSIDDNDDVNVNFQASGHATPAGYVADVGNTFGSRGNGLSFGWDADITGNARNRASSTLNDFRYESLIKIQDRKWEIAVPNGLYEVTLVAGDPDFTDSVYQLNLEGTLALSGTPANRTRWFKRTVNVQVDDGKLTLTSAAGSANNKIAFMDIKGASYGAIAGPVTDNLPVSLPMAAKPAKDVVKRPKAIFSDIEI